MDFDTSKEAINLEIHVLENEGNSHLANLMKALLDERELMKFEILDLKQDLEYHREFGGHI
jgi:uncharacterized protein YaiI (UPF0178 family)